MNIDNLNLVELNTQEVQEVTGGGRGKSLLRAFEFIMTAAGVYDAIDDFKTGWNSCGCNSSGSGSSGSW